MTQQDRLDTYARQNHRLTEYGRVRLPRYRILPALECDPAMWNMKYWASARQQRRILKKYWRDDKLEQQVPF